MRHVLKFLRPKPAYNFLQLDYWFGQVDSLPLSLFRIVFAAILLKDALYHMPLAQWFYSDDGIVTIEMARDLTYLRHMSLMYALPETWMALAFFILWALVLVALLLGWRTRLMAILNFIIIVSVHLRNPMLLNGGDTIMRALSFWMIFLPLGHYFSLDARRRNRDDSLERRLHPRTAFALPLRMMQIQIAIVYLFTALLKNHPTWLNGDALFYTLQLESLTFPYAQWLLANLPYAMLQVLTWATLLIEGGFMVMVFSPLFQPYLRIIALISGVLLHVGIAVTMTVPNFSMVMIASYIVFLQPEWIRGALSRFGMHTPAVIWPQSEHRNRYQRYFLRGVRVVQISVLCSIMYGVILWNIPTERPPNGLRQVIEYSGLWQWWDMFAPYPLRVESKTVIIGYFDDGRVVDLRTNQRADSTITRWYWGPDLRWRKFEERLRADRPASVLQQWSRTYCHRYRHADEANIRLDRIQIVLFERYSYAPGERPNTVQTVVLWNQGC